MSSPIVPATIDFGADGASPRAPEFGDVYHPRVGAAAQARHVFLGGNGLPARWAGRDRFVILETGFGLGHNFIATWQAWRDDPARPRRLVHVAVEKHPPRRADLERAHAGSPSPTLVAALAAAWPALTAGVHTLHLDGGRVRLLLALGDVVDVLPALDLAADAVYLDGFAPDRNPAMWSLPVLKAIGRRCAPGATAATWSVAAAVRSGLVTAGFDVERAPGVGGKREITVARLGDRLSTAAARPRAPSSALVVGAGLAGAFTAAALADEGLEVVVIDRAHGPASAASSQPAGMFHGTVHADDGAHARLLRAAALTAAATVDRALAAGVPGARAGLLRLGGRPLDEMRSIVRRQGLPPDWVEALDADAASALAGVALPEAAWHFPHGGLVAPAALSAWAMSAPSIRFAGARTVARLEATGASWRALDADGAQIAEADVAVVAAAADALPLLAGHGFDAPLLRWRGQTTGWGGAPVALRRPVAGDGYALPLPDGGLLCGATHTVDDDDPTARAEDAEANLARLLRLTGLRPPDGAALFGRVGWRAQCADRLPIAGAVPAPRAAQTTAFPRMPRIDGLHVVTALGGRGLTLAPLLGAIVTARATGAPLPIERDLLDAIDPARFRVRAARRG